VTHSRRTFGFQWIHCRHSRSHSQRRRRNRIIPDSTRLSAWCGRESDLTSFSACKLLSVGI